jgi:tRNA(Ile)-lysidine synthetase-like protein
MTGETTPPCPFPALDAPGELELPRKLGQVTEAALGGWRVTAQLVPRPETLDAGGQLTAYLAPEALPGRMLVRTRRRGDRFWPLGMTQEKKLQDFLTDLKVPRTWRDRVPLVAAAEGIAWVVGYRVAQWARVRTESGEDAPVLRMKFERTDDAGRTSLRNTWSHLPELSG